MLFKFVQAKKSAQQITEQVQQRHLVPTMKFTNLPSSVSSKFNRKIIRSVNKGSIENLRRFEDSDPSEWSSDSGLGLDHQLEVQLATRNGLLYASNQGVKTWWTGGEGPEVKKKKYNYQFEADEINEDFCFPDIVSRKTERESGFHSKEKPGHGMPGRGRGVTGAPVTLSTPLTASSQDGKTQLLIVCQPEQQHRARYQTEGSRGAVKDRTGNGFPVVKLAGYSKPTTLQIFIGTDVGRVTPHMFYQACRVSGKNSTPCVERKVDGTVVIEVDLDPSKDMVITCDCVGILKERNVDVEHRFPDQTGTRNKKKSTRCRMVFRTTIINSDGTPEVLQVCSHPIVCTQPPGVPEICKKSLTSCPATGGAELFILGKNFLKDTKVIFQQAETHPPWEETVLPDKEFLQQTHLICGIPPYRSVDIMEPVTVKIFVTSSGKASDPHTFTYLPAGSPIVPSLVDASPCSSYLSSPLSQAFVNGNRVFAKASSNMPPILPAAAPLMKPSTMKPSGYFDAIKKDVPMMWPPPTKPEATEEDDKMMPPPPALIPITRRPSVSMLMTENEAAELKMELIDEVSQNSVEHDQSSLSPSDMQGVDLSMKTPLLRHLVDIPPVAMASLGVDKYFSKGDPPPKPAYSVYETDQQRQFLEEDLLRPTPAKMPNLEFSVSASGMGQAPFPRAQCLPSPTVIHSSVAMSQSPQTGFEAGSTETASIAEAPLSENSASGFDAYPRVRISNLSQNYNHSAPFESRSTVMRAYESEPSPMVLSNDCSIDSAISSVVKQAVRKMESALYCHATTSPSSSLTQVTSNTAALNSLVCPDIMATTQQTRNLDDFVNCAAESHICSKNEEPYMQTAQGMTPVVEGATQADHAFGGRYRDDMLPTPTTELVGSGTQKEVSSPGENLADARVNRYDGLMTPNQMMTEPIDKMNESPQSGSPLLNPMIPVPSSSPVTQGATTQFSATVAEDVKPGTRTDAESRVVVMSTQETETRPPETGQPMAKDVTYSTKDEVGSEMSLVLKPSPASLAVKNMTEREQKMGDVFATSGSTPPITGMVPQEMVKMTDNDLISYINPSCFDQVGYVNEAGRDL